MVKKIVVDGLGEVDFVKRKKQKSIRIKVVGSRVKVTLPYYSSYTFARKFVESKQDWIEENINATQVYESGFGIGKSVRLVIEPGRVRSAHKQTELFTGPDVSQIETAIHKSLLRQSQRLLPQRVEALGSDFQIKDLNFKRMRGRWGSCSSDKTLTFNTYIIQLPWHLIDYVIVHELAHLKHMDHSKEFWAFVESMLSDYKDKRKELRTWQPIIYNTSYGKSRSAS